MPETRLPLWEDESGIIGEPPSLTLFPTSAATPRGGVMVCPGGGYENLADHEGPDVARRLSEAGFDAAVLRYRRTPNRHPGMHYDAQRGLRLMRSHPQIRAENIAVMGFSAGGHLASTLAVLPEAFAHPQDHLQRFTARPDAAVLCYPFIDIAGPATHAGSRDNLLGEAPDEKLLWQLSTQHSVCSDTPPMFLWHTADDAVVPMENSLAMARACRRAGVPVEMHLYEQGVHGVGLAEDLPHVRPWFEACLAFLDRHLAP